MIPVFIDSSSEINTITLVYIEKLGLWVHKTDIDTQKIDGTTLVTYEIVIANFSIQDKHGKDRFFEKTFLVANISMEVILSMAFLFLFDINIRFTKTELE